METTQMIISVNVISSIEIKRDRWKFETDAGEFFFRGEISDKLIFDGGAFKFYYVIDNGKKVIQYFGPVEVPNIVVPPQPSSEKSIDFGTPPTSLLEAIWMSPALGTQPGNPDEIAKIAKKWYEESLTWLL